MKYKRSALKLVFVVVVLSGFSCPAGATILEMEASGLENGAIFEDLYVGSSYTAAYGDYVNSITQAGRQIWNGSSYVNSTFTYGVGAEGFTPNIRAYFPYRGDAGVAREGGALGLAPRASVAAEILVLAALAAGLEREKGFTKADYNLRHPAGKLGEHTR